MPAAARVRDQTSHGAPLGSGPGSPNVRIGGANAWRALPEGQTGAALESAAQKVQSFMSTAVLTPASAAVQLVQIQAGLLDASGRAAGEGNPAAAPAAGTAMAVLNASNATLSATWATASVPPGAMPAANATYTEGIKAAVASAAGAVFAAIARAADMHNCPRPCPNPLHGPGVVTRGSQTVRINGLPAVRKGDKVVEACGGSDAIGVGCATVSIGDLSVSGSAAAAAEATGTPGGGADDAMDAVVQAKEQKTVPAAPTAAPAPESVGPLRPRVSPQVEPTWIGIVLRDFDDRPMPNQDFTVTLHSGQILSGRTDARGYMRFEGVRPGAGDVTFVRIPDAPAVNGEESDGVKR